MATLAERIWIAVEDGRLDDAVILLTTATKIDLRYQKALDGNLYTTLSLAACRGETELVRVLADAGADLDQKDSVDGWTALMQASAYGHAATVLVLAHLGANLNLQKSDGSTALMLASANGHTEVVEALLQHSADVNLVDKEGWTALIMASKYGHIDIVRALTQWEADLNVQEKDHWTAVMFAAASGHTEVVRILAHAGANLNIQQKDGCTALILAAFNGHGLTVRALLRAGADRTIRHTGGKTAAEVAKTEEIKTQINIYVPRSRADASPIRKPVPTPPPAAAPVTAAAAPGPSSIQKAAAVVAAAASAATHAVAAAAVAVGAVAFHLHPTEHASSASAHPAASSTETSAAVSAPPTADPLPASAVSAADAAPSQTPSIPPPLPSTPLPNPTTPPPEAVVSAPTPSPVRMASEHQIPLAPPRPPPKPRMSEQARLERDCDALVAQAAHLPACRDALQQRQALKQQYDAAVATGDLEAASSVGLQLSALPDLPLQESVYVSFAERHATLVERVTAKYAQLLETQELAAAESLGAKLAVVKALDLSALSESSHTNRVEDVPIDAKETSMTTATAPSGSAPAVETAQDSSGGGDSKELPLPETHGTVPADEPISSGLGDKCVASEVPVSDPNLSEQLDEGACDPVAVDAVVDVPADC